MNFFPGDAVNFVGSEDSTVIEMCALVDFLLDIVSIETYVETASEHLPNLFKSVINVLNVKVKDLTTVEVTKALQLAKKLLTKVQPAWNAWDVDGDKANQIEGIVKSQNFVLELMATNFIPSQCYLFEKEFENPALCRNVVEKRGVFEVKFVQIQVVQKFSIVL